MNKDFFKITAVYTIGIIVAFTLIWALLDIVMPEANLNLVRALSTAFGINLPDDMMVGTQMGLKAAAVIVIISVLSIGLIVLNVYFGAIVTTHFIRPRVNLVTSTRGVLSTKWNAEKPYILMRLANFHHADLVNISINVVLTVQEIRSNGVKDEQFISYLPMQDFTPPRILVMSQNMPWTLAVCADASLSSSLTKNYAFKPGMPITKSFSPGKKISYVKRTLEVLIEGTDLKSYASFVIHKKLLVDEQEGDKYTLHLHAGSFKSLPLHIDSASDLEQYV
jgi:hypothetical protein